MKGKTMNKKYRVCKNKYGWYKIQIWRPPQKFLLFFEAPGYWADGAFEALTEKVIRFKTKKEAETQIEIFKEFNRQENNEWQSEGEY